MLKEIYLAALTNYTKKLIMHLDQGVYVNPEVGWISTIGLITTSVYGFSQASQAHNLLVSRSLAPMAKEEWNMLVLAIVFGMLPTVILAIHLLGLVWSRMIKRINPNHFLVRMPKNSVTNCTLEMGCSLFLVLLSAYPLLISTVATTALRMHFH